MQKGIFVSFEGSEGCGKTTQIERLCARLAAAGIEVLKTREPGGTRLGEAIRHLLKFAPEGQGMTPESELLLFEASRAQLVREVIRPALDRGAFVVSDRFHDSTTVYQGIARNIDPETVRRLNAFAVGETAPHATFVMDLDPAEARVRMLRRPRPVGAADRMEQEPEEFYRDVREGYLALAKNDPGRVIVIDGAGKPDEIERTIWNHLTQRFHGILERHGI